MVERPRKICDLENGSFSIFSNSTADFNTLCLIVPVGGNNDKKQFKKF